MILGMEEISPRDGTHKTVKKDGSTSKFKKGQKGEKSGERGGVKNIGGGPDNGGTGEPGSQKGTRYWD